MVVSAEVVKVVVAVVEVMAVAVAVVVVVLVLVPVVVVVVVSGRLLWLRAQVARERALIHARKVGS